MAECIVSSRRPCHSPQGTGPLRSSAFSPGPSTCQAPQDHTPVGCGPQSSHVFSAAMTQKSLRYKAMISANMLKLFSISRPNGRLLRYSLPGCWEGYVARFPSHQ
jgi:hypothetical protein